MGDRTNCSLTLYGLIPQTEVQDLHMALMAQGLVLDRDDVIDAITETLEIESVDRGILTDVLQDLLIAKRISFVWSWGTGSEYSEGIEAYDATTGRWFDATTSQSDIVIRLADVGKPEIIKAAQDLQDFLRTLKDKALYVTHSEHDALERAGSDPFYRDHLVAMPDAGGSDAGAPETANP